MRKFPALILWVAIVFNANAQTINRTMVRLPDTGSTQSYTSTFGEDNDYIFNSPSYTDNGDGTITDNITGLMWQKVDGGEMTIENAITYCSDLTLAGYDDWRLPSPIESFSILNQQNNNPAINNTYFTATGAEYWWTSAYQINDANKVWVTNAGGGIGNHPKSETISAGGIKRFHARAVRQVLAPTNIASRFLDNSDGTITDLFTDLVWPKTVSAATYTWEQALGYAENLDLAGFSDWRLPNIKELQSLSDPSLIAPSVNNTAFENMVVNHYWSSTSLPNQTTKAWYLDTQFGITTYDEKTIAHPVLAVRGNSGDATAVSEISQQKIHVYPNPFSSNLTISGASNGANISLKNYVGQTIWSGRIFGTTDFSWLSEGIYFLSVEKETQIVVKE
jgi:hypothetical protein